MSDFNLIKDEIENVYMNGNWNSVYGFLRKNNIKHSLHVEEFGLSGKKSRDKMERWLNEEEEKI